MTPWGLGCDAKGMEGAEETAQSFRHHLLSPHQSGGRSDEGRLRKERELKGRKPQGESHCRGCPGMSRASCLGLSSPSGSLTRFVVSADRCTCSWSVSQQRAS